MNTTEEKPARALDAPANHNLQDCLQELKAGRKANQQKFLDECIEKLNIENVKFNNLIKIHETINQIEDVAYNLDSSIHAKKLNDNIEILRKLIE